MKIFLNSLPKSGTNYMAKILEGCEYNYSEIGIASTSVYGRFSYPKFLLRGISCGGKHIEVGVDTNAKVSRRWLEKTLASVKDGFYLSGHVPYSKEFDVLLKEYGISVIYISRNPLDVILSWSLYVANQPWHYAYSQYKNISDIDELVLKTLRGGQIKGVQVYPFNDIYRRSMGWLKSDNSFAVTYESLLSQYSSHENINASKIITELADFMQRPPSTLVSAIVNTYGKSHTFRVGQARLAEKSLRETTILEIKKSLKDFPIGM